MSRTSQSLKNIFAGIGSQIFLTALSFFTTRVIKNSLGFEYLGLNGVFSNIISLMSLTEMGIGSAIVFALYKPLAEDNNELICALMRFYRTAYRIIAMVVFLIGFALLPLLSFFINTTLSISYVRFAFMLFVFNSAFSYFLSYKRNLIFADQKNYVITLYSLIFAFITKIGQLFVFIITSNYILYLLVDIFCTIGLNVLISWKADKLYPFIKNVSNYKLPIEIKNMLISKVKALFLHLLGTKVVFATDNILIAYYFGVSMVGKYACYAVITQFIVGLISQIYGAIQASVGNFIVEKNSDEQYGLFRKLEFLTAFLSIFSAVCLASLLTPFISWWLGNDSILPNSTVYLLVISNFIALNRSPVLTMKEAAGLFEQDKYAPLIESIINLIVSFVLARLIGLQGVILGTIIGYLMVPVWVQTKIVYNYLFNKKMYLFFMRQLLYFIIVVILTAVIKCVLPNIWFCNKTFTLVLYFVVTISVCLLVEVLIFFRSEYFIYFKKMIFRPR